MNKSLCGIVAVACVMAVAGGASASSVSEREYKRGFADCSRGDYDQNQHGSSYKRGCRAAEDSGQSTGASVRDKANRDEMRAVCRGSVIGRFHHFARTVRITKTEHERGNWQLYGDAVLDDGSTSDFVCMFSSTGHFMRLEASQPMGGHNQLDHEGYCPPDVAEANRYQYPGCN
jgi:hypothetical protein